MSSLAERLTEAMRRKGMTQAELGKICGVAQPSVGKWMNGTTKQLKTSTAFQVAKALDVSLKWLTEGIGNWDDKYIDPNVVPAPKGTKRIPVIASVEAGLPTWIGDCDFDEWIMGDEDYSDETFALRINGESMEPEFSRGDMVIIDPSLNPRPSDFVVAQTPDGTEGTFKKYKLKRRRPDGTPVFQLVPLNPDYPTIDSEEYPMLIVGVMVEHRKFRNRY